MILYTCSLNKLNAACLKCRLQALLISFILLEILNSTNSWLFQSKLPLTLLQYIEKHVLNRFFLVSEQLIQLYLTTGWYQYLHREVTPDKNPVMVTYQKMPKYSLMRIRVCHTKFLTSKQLHSYHHPDQNCNKPLPLGLPQRPLP